MNSPEAVVTYRCVVNGCGLSLLGITERDGRPIFGYWTRNMAKRVWPPGPGVSWQEKMNLDDPNIAKGGIEFGCRRHGTWHMTYAAMLDDWQRSRRLGQNLEVKLSDESEWRGPFQLT